MNREIRRYQHLIISFFIGIIACIGIVVGVVPLIRRTVESVEDIRVLSEDIKNIQSRIYIYEQYDQSQLLDHAKLVLSALPEDKSIASIFLAIDRLVVTSGATLLDTSLANAGSLATESAQLRLDFEKKTGIHIVPLSVSIVGPSQSIESFINSVESSRRLMMVRDFDMSQMKDGNISLRAAIDVFYKPFDGRLAKTTSTTAGLTESEENTLVKISRMEFVSDIQNRQEQLSTGIKGRDDPFVP